MTVTCLVCRQLVRGRHLWALAYQVFKGPKHAKTCRWHEGEAST